MDNLTQAEQKLFSKWYGDSDIPWKDEFWADAYKYYSEENANVLLPLGYNPLTVRMVLDMLDCQKCGDCCRYDRVPVRLSDTERIKLHTNYTYEDLKNLITVKDGKSFFEAGEKGCPFLKDNKCTIYPYRPDGCYLFPIQAPVESRVNGRTVEQMTIRIKCPQTMEIAKRIILRAFKEGNRMLLPNLMVIDKSEKEVEEDGSD